MNKFIKTAIAAAALTIAASTVLAGSVSTSCGGGFCKVTINGVSKTFKGSSAKVFSSSVNGVSSFAVFIDGKQVQF
jgi:hypothetical protein